jgi:hypothetical protein
MSKWAVGASSDQYYKSLISVMIPAIATIWPAIGAVGAFAAERQVEVQKQTPDDAIVISRVRLGDSELRCGLPITRSEQPRYQSIVPFEAGSDWLGNLKIDILNRTDKTIAYLQIYLGFPETGDGLTRETAGLNHYITRGRIPAQANLPPRPPDLSRAPISLLPGQTLHIQLSDEVEILRESLGKFPKRPLSFASVTKCFIGRAGVYFDDGMSWHVHEYSIPDRELPGKFQNLESGFFPGDRMRYWPRARE